MARQKVAFQMPSFPSVAALRRAPEPDLLPRLVVEAENAPSDAAAIQEIARNLIEAARRRGAWMDEFLQAYGLSTTEGRALLSLAEAYLRVPDTSTASALVRDKLSHGDWHAQPGHAASFAIEAATLSLAIAQRLSDPGQGSALQTMLARGGEPFIRRGVTAAMQMMGSRFVLGGTIEEAIRRAAKRKPYPVLCSFDMLGEAAMTENDAERYLEAYRKAIYGVGSHAAASVALMERHAVSIKLSALDPRYSFAQADRCVSNLIEKGIRLAEHAAACGIGLTIDAEESDRLDLSLAIIEGMASAASLKGWDGLGMAVQAYQKAAPAVIQWAEEISFATGRRLAVRLVKGAYWDTEIKRCQERGLSGYPVFTRKASTDVSYLACAKLMLGAAHLQPAFATHNALTVATLLNWAGNRRDVEFQRLHGMGEALYDKVLEDHGLRCRVYAPVGGYRDLLAYLVRRLLENGANTSFVHQLADMGSSADVLLADPVSATKRANFQPHPNIPEPAGLFGTLRRNSRGIDLADQETVDVLLKNIALAGGGGWHAAPIVAGEDRDGTPSPARSPADTDCRIGTVITATSAMVDAAAASAMNAIHSWSETDVDERAACLERAAGLLEENEALFMALAIYEAGKTLSDALSELREAVDFCRFYASEARRVLVPQILPGPTGEHNELTLKGRGVFGCISPWNFPLAIFMGQVTAALVAGNAVLAKPAPQTPLIAAEAVRLLHRAGIPPEALHYLPGGPKIGQAIAADSRIAGIAFTGSMTTARRIARTLLEDDRRPLVPLIAETGGVNAMIVDSTALPEQVVADVVASAFQSAGQRCSALRLLCLQEEIAPRVLEMLGGAISLLRLGDPAELSTDIGPVIDAAARDALLGYIEEHKSQILFRSSLDGVNARGFFVPPCIVQLDQPEALTREIFGPVLHVVTWAAGQLEHLVDRINASGYGLTMGLHSRIGSVADLIRNRAHVGNLYVNRTMIGAVVGAQPFGGEGLSGTGPKAGGPHYLHRFVTERAISIDITAAGGNAGLLSLGAE